MSEEKGRRTGWREKERERGSKDEGDGVKEGS